VPSGAGTYTWSALVTPASSWAPDPSGAFELRALVPIPNELTAHVRYDTKAQSAVLTGKLTAGGKPRGGVDVYVRTGGESSSLSPSATTDATGSFSARKPVAKTTTYLVGVADENGPCSDPS